MIRNFIKNIIKKEPSVSHMNLFIYEKDKKNGNLITWTFCVFDESVEGCILHWKRIETNKDLIDFVTNGAFQIEKEEFNFITDYMNKEKEKQNNNFIKHFNNED